MTANYYPDGLTFEAITALQQQVDDELRHEGYPIEPLTADAGRDATARGCVGRHEAVHAVMPPPALQSRTSLPSASPRRGPHCGAAAGATASSSTTTAPRPCP